MNNNKIVIKGAKEHNLKNIDIEIPKAKLDLPEPERPNTEATYFEPSASVYSF